MKHKIVLIIAVFFLGCVANIHAQTAEEIVKKSRDILKLKGQEAISTLEIVDQKGRKRVRQTSVASKMYGETEKRIIRFMSPADVKGTSMLIFDYGDKNDDMWIYMPALRKTRRIVSTDKGKSFMGSEFANSDLSAPTLEDFTYKILGEEKISETNCWKIESVPVNTDVEDENGYIRKISWIEKDTYIMRKSVYWDLDEELWKEMLCPGVELLDKQNGIYAITHMTMENKQNGRKSSIKMDKVVYSPNVKDEYFTTDYLEKL